MSWSTDPSECLSEDGSGCSRHETVRAGTTKRLRKQVADLKARLKDFDQRLSYMSCLCRRQNEAALNLKLKSWRKHGGGR